MTGPKLSVIIPCYKQAHLLHRAINSLLCQARRSDIEIVVINDGSPDNTSEVAARYADSIVYVEQENRGLSGARNAGIDVASGEYLMFLDADDEAHPELSDAMSDCDGQSLVAMNYIIRCDWTGTESRHATGPRPITAVSCFNQNICPPLGAFVQRALAQGVGGFDPRFKSCEDWDFWIRALLSGNGVVQSRFCSGIYYLYASSMASAFPRMWDSAHQVWNKNAAAVGPLVAPLASRRHAFYENTLRERIFERLYSGGPNDKIRLLLGLGRRPSLARIFLRERVSRRLRQLTGVRA